METRQIIAWAIIAFLLFAAVIGLWLATTVRRRQRKRENRAFDRRSAAGRDAARDEG